MPALSPFHGHGYEVRDRVAGAAVRARDGRPQVSVIRRFKILRLIRETRDGARQAGAPGEASLQLGGCGLGDCDGRILRAGSAE